MFERKVRKLWDQYLQTDHPRDILLYKVVMRYNRPRRQLGICLLAAINNALNIIMFKNMEQFTMVISRLKSRQTQAQLEEYLQFGSIFFKFRGPIVMKEEYPYFLWFSILIVDRISPEEITHMVKNDITLEDVFQGIRKTVKEVNFIMQTNLLSTSNVLKVGDRHVFNVKYLSDSNQFFMHDEEEPYPQTLGYPCRQFLKTCYDITIYAFMETERTTALMQGNHAGYNAKDMLRYVGQEADSRFPKELMGVPTIRKSKKKQQHSGLHPLATSRATKFYLKLEGDADHARNSLGGQNSKRNKYW